MGLFSYTLTRDFLQNRKLAVEPMLKWLRENLARCDWEIIYNVGEDREDRAPWNAI